MAISAFSSGSQAGQRLLSGSSILRSNVGLSYGAGFAAFIVALALRFWLDDTLPAGFPFLTFIPAVIISAFLAGTRAGVLCATLSFLAAWYWFIEGAAPFSIIYGSAVALGFFTFISAVDIAIIEAAARAVDRLIAHEAQLNKTRIDLEEALKAKEVLLYEVNHRVKNSLQLVSSFLLLETSKIRNGEARSAVMAARTKVDLVARLHQLLYGSDSHDRVNLKAALEDVINQLILSAGRDDIHLECRFSGDLMMSIRQASPMVLAVNEIVTNSLKYGLSGEQPKLTVIANNVGDEMMLVIRDNGPGIAATSTDNRPGMGSEIVQGLVRQMRGTLVIESDSSGTANVLTVPFDPQSPDQIGAS